MEDLDPFWFSFNQHGNNTAVIDNSSDTAVSYRDLDRLVTESATKFFPHTGALVLICVENDLGSLIGYLSALAARCAVFLCPTRYDDPIAARYIAQYEPQYILSRCWSNIDETTRGYQLLGRIEAHYLIENRSAVRAPTHPDLAVLLSTSASTGNQKTVKLSRQNLLWSCLQVVRALGITAGDRSAVCLSMSYVYGLSVINSHLFAGATLILSDLAPVNRRFWNSLLPHEPTSIATVSQTLHFIKSLEIGPAELPHLRSITHSGERLDSRTFQWVFGEFAARGVNLYLMYGQSEATGRIAVLNPSWLPEAADSVGTAVTGGQISIGPGDEVIYSGPNVMMGYANSREDLQVAGEPAQILFTGDTGYLDHRGLLHLTGRRSREQKIFGRRMNLDDVEALLRRYGEIAVTSSAEVLVIFCEEQLSNRTIADILGCLHSELRIPPQKVELRKVERLPRNTRGKLTHRALLDLSHNTLTLIPGG